VWREDSRDIAGLPIDLIAQTIEPTEAQRAALDDLCQCFGRVSAEDQGGMPDRRLR
jgi:hypothetical protein